MHLLHIVVPGNICRTWMNSPMAHIWRHIGYNHGICFEFIRKRHHVSIFGNDFLFKLSLYDYRCILDKMEQSILQGNQHICALKKSRVLWPTPFITCLRCNVLMRGSQACQRQGGQSTPAHVLHSSLAFYLIRNWKIELEVREATMYCMCFLQCSSSSEQFSIEWSSSSRLVSTTRAHSI